LWFKCGALLENDAIFRITIPGGTKIQRLHFNHKHVGNILNNKYGLSTGTSGLLTESLTNYDYVNLPHFENSTGGRATLALAVFSESDSKRHFRVTLPVKNVKIGLVITNLLCRRHPCVVARIITNLFSRKNFFEEVLP
jgi:hypothetical protein